MAGTARKFARITKFLLAGVTVFCVSWIASVNEWHASMRWSERRAGVGRGLTTMRTIVAYSEGKQAEMDRPSPVTCDRLPDYPEVPFINRTWSPGVTKPSSWQQVAGTQVSLYAAYYDQRTTQRYVRILASFHGRNYSAEKTLYCQTRSKYPYENNVEVVAAKPLEIWWYEWDINSIEVDTPLLLSCSLTEPLNGPSIVSVVTEPCDNPTNAFPLEPEENRQENRNFTICVKDMNFDKDISQSLVEWVETNKILGVDIIDVYVDKVSKQTANVLQHYRDEGYIRLFDVPVSNKPGRSLWQRRRDHIITYNDCLYRNIKDTIFIVPLDVDEIILPKITYTWPELLHRLKEYGWNDKEYSAIMIQNVFFFDFMQKIHKVNNNDAHERTNQVYVKRDDVRIDDVETIDLDELELIDDNYIANTTIENAILLNKYKLRCGMDLPEPKLSRHVVSSAVISPIGYYSKSFMVTKKVLTVFNHYPLASLGASRFTGWSAPFSEVQLNHYKESCNMTVVVECGRYERRARVDRAALRLRTNLTRALATAICIPINNT
ncbi:uncharacterized protein LOC115456131 [Manduca sexta]|uniref:uncharacterized protein LOC115456131 n=1 Tax=Manduca sexta TaxID=7130 RepID=UPI00188DCFC9|nr:uncharacterized protein LOC115456131 [Manduca sexta]